MRGGGVLWGRLEFRLGGHGRPHWEGTFEQSLEGGSRQFRNICECVI